MQDAKRVCTGLQKQTTFTKQKSTTRVYLHLQNFQALAHLFLPAIEQLFDLNQDATDPRLPKQSSHRVQHCNRNSKIFLENRRKKKAFLERKNNSCVGTTSSANTHSTCIVCTQKQRYKYTIKPKTLGLLGWNNFIGQSKSCLFQ